MQQITFEQFKEIEADAGVISDHLCMYVDNLEIECSAYDDTFVISVGEVHEEALGIDEIIRLAVEKNRVFDSVQYFATDDENEVKQFFLERMSKSGTFNY